MTTHTALFPAEITAPPNRRILIEETRATLGQGVSFEAARGFLYLSILPPSKRWVFLSLGKNASSSTLKLLFEMEFGHKLSASFTPLADINPSAVVHKLADTGVFTRALNLGLTAQTLVALPAERLLVVRNPYARAVSSFRYFCKSNDLGSPWFLASRLRATAMVGFDWETMPYTVEGLRRFLAYIEAEVAAHGAPSLDSHWSIQAVSSFPGVFRPTLLGRVEALADFHKALADRLGQPLPDAVAHENRQENAPDSLIRDPDARRMIERIYAPDFEAFGY
jgi:Sulfotransferase family